MVRLALVAVGAVVAGVFALPESRASLHHPDDPMALTVNAKDEPQALEFGEFGRRRLVLMNAGNATWPLERADPTDPAKKTRSDRGVLKDRIDRRLKLRERSELDNVALAVDWLRFGQPDEAAAALRGARRGFLPNITLAHIAIAQNSREHPTWAQAFEYLDIANAEAPPKQFPGLTPQQLAWQLKLNRGPLLKLVQLRMQEARAKPAPESELPDALFPVNFADTAPDGLLSPAERAKLSPDALATVQQLILWFPHDTRLYWLLAELYAARGEYRPAQKIMDECVSSLTYSNRKALVQHREAVAKAAAQLAPPPDDPLLGQPDKTDADDTPAPPFTLGAVWLYFGAVGLVALFAGVRAVLKWRKGAAR